MATRIDADIDVQRFGFIADELGNRLVFPLAHATHVEGTAGDASYGATRCAFSGLEGQIGGPHQGLAAVAEMPGSEAASHGEDVQTEAPRWKADAAVLEAAWLRDRHDRYEVVAARVDHPRGIRLFQGVDHNGHSQFEIVAPEIVLSELRITVTGPFSSNAPAAATSASAPRPTKFRFLDGLSGRLSSTLKVRLDLPVLGVRTLDQELRVPVQDGTIDFRALEDSLHWLGGAFLDVAHDNDQLKVGWKVPIVGPSHDLVTWPLDDDATAFAAQGRIPIRSLTDPRLVSSESDDASNGKDKRKVVHSLAIESIDIALSLLTPHRLELDSGVIAFGSDQQPGVVDFQVTGAVSDHGPGTLTGTIASVDTAIKGLRIGALELTADRLVLEGVEQLEIGFDRFRPTGLSAFVRRATATNVSLKRRSS